MDETDEGLFGRGDEYTHKIFVIRAREGGKDVFFVCQPIARISPAEGMAPRDGFYGFLHAEFDRRARGTGRSEASLAADGGDGGLEEGGRDEGTIDAIEIKNELNDGSSVLKFGPVRRFGPVND